MAKKNWKIKYDKETDFHSIFDSTGTERFRGKTKVLSTYLAENMKELDEAREKIEMLQIDIDGLEEYIASRDMGN